MIESREAGDSLASPRGRHQFPSLVSRCFCVGDSGSDQGTAVVCVCRQHNSGDHHVMVSPSRDPAGTSVPYGFAGLVKERDEVVGEIQRIRCVRHILCSHRGPLRHIARLLDSQDPAVRQVCGSRSRIELFDVVVAEYRIGCHQPHPVCPRLTDEKPIDGIGEVIVELADAECVAGIDREMEDP